jgi:hypothetical protein
MPDLGVPKSIRHLPQLRGVMRGINDRMAWAHAHQAPAAGRPALVIPLVEEYLSNRPRCRLSSLETLVDKLTASVNTRPADLRISAQAAG